MSRSLSQPTHLDWQALLLEAIHHRDAARAAPLAQRCVHRYGMATLQALLERADAAAGKEGEARDWLLLLLKQGPPDLDSRPIRPDLPPGESVPNPSPVERAAPAGDPPHGLGTPLQAVEGASESLSAAAPTPESIVGPAPDPGSASEAARSNDGSSSVAGHTAFDEASANEVATASEVALSNEGSFAVAGHVANELASAREAALSDEVPSAREALSWEEVPEERPPANQFVPIGKTAAAPRSASASAALDQAFAPLEIAFPPLPALDRQEPREPSAASLPAPPLSLSPTHFSVPPELSRGEDQEVADAAQAMVMEQEKPDQGPLLDDFKAGTAAAPVPTFHVDRPVDRAPAASRKRRQSDEPVQEQAPVSRALEAWRAWLPGAFRSRPKT